MMTFSLDYWVLVRVSCLGAQGRDGQLQLHLMKKRSKLKGAFAAATSLGDAKPTLEKVLLYRLEVLIQ